MTSYDSVLLIDCEIFRDLSGLHPSFSSFTSPDSGLVADPYLIYVLRGCGVRQCWKISLADLLAGCHQSNCPYFVVVEDSVCGFLVALTAISVLASLGPHSDISIVGLSSIEKSSIHKESDEISAIFANATRLTTSQIAGSALLIDSLRIGGSGSLDSFMRAAVTFGFSFANDAVYAIMLNERSGVPTYLLEVLNSLSRRPKTVAQIVASSITDNRPCGHDVLLYDEIYALTEGPTPLLQVDAPFTYRSRLKLTDFGKAVALGQANYRALAPQVAGRLGGSWIYSFWEPPR